MCIGIEYVRIFHQDTISPTHSQVTENKRRAKWSMQPVETHIFSAGIAEPAGKAFPLPLGTEDRASTKERAGWTEAGGPNSF